MEKKSTSNFQNWKMQATCCLFFYLCLGITGAMAQQAGTYTYTTLTGQALDAMSGPTQLLGKQEDNTPSANTNVGFNFSFEGTIYTTFSVTPDGFVKLGAVTTGQANNVMTNINNIPKLCPWWDDSHTGGALSAGEVTTVLTGSSPNRIRVIQFFTTVPKASGIAAFANATYQVWLYENTNVIEFRYGSSTNGTSATVGIRGAIATPASFISITTSSHTASTVTANDANSVWPGSGRMYRFTPPFIPCSGIPNPGATVTSNSTVCTGTPFTLSLANIVVGSNVIYQWQSGPSATGPWTTFGANSPAIATSLTVTTWYQCNVTCTGNTVTSTPVQVTAANCCNYTFRLRDDFGDGWNGALMQVRIGTTVIATLGSTFTNGTVFDETIQLISGTTYNLFYLNDGSFPAEVGVRVFDPNAVAIHNTPFGSGTVGTILFTFAASCPVPCSGTPAPGTTLTDLTAACPTDVFTLSLSTNFLVTGITYQWQNSPNGTTWSNIGGATLETYSGSQAVATYYRCRVTCNGSATGNSTARFIGTTLCYCESAANNAPDDEIFNVTLNTLNNTTVCNSTGPGAGSVRKRYGNYTTLTPTNLTQGITYPINLTLGYCDGTAYETSAAVFIDFNQNGIFDASERVYNSPYQEFAVGGSVVSGTVEVPGCALPGVTRMRVVMTEFETAPAACGIYDWGETEDYFVNIVAAPIVPPVASTISGPLSGTCNTSLSYTIASGYSGIIQWQTASSAGGPYTDIPGATLANQPITPPSPGTYFLRAAFTGQGCVTDVYSNILTVTISAPVISVTANTPNSVCRGTAVQLTASGSGPYFWSTGGTTATIAIMPLVTNTYTVTSGSGTCKGTGSKTITVIGGPIAGATVTPTGLRCPGTTRTLQANLVNGASTSTSFGGGGITIPLNAPSQTSGTSNPYPSNLSVSGLAGTQTVANVKINGFTHSYPEDVDIVLVAPDGSKVILLADNGNGNSVTGINLTLQDGSANLPGTLATGTFRTSTNAGWSGTGLAAPYFSTLSSFTGSFNGTWKLYVFDDVGGDYGSIDSWSITFTSAVTTFNYNGPVTYSWSAAGGYTSNAVNPVVNPLTNTTYTLTVADNSCSSSSQVTVQVRPAPTVTTFTGTPFCENSAVDFFTDGNGATSTGTAPGTLTVNISGPGFLDEISWNIMNSSNVIIASGGNYANGSTNTIPVNPSATDYPVTFNIETQGAFGDNEANYSVVCSFGTSTLTGGTILGGNTFSSGPLNCGSPLGTILYSWTGPNSFSSTLEDPSIPSAVLANSGDYTVTITDGNGCNASFTTTVVINENPELYIASANNVSCDGFADGSFQIGVNGGTPYFSFFETTLGQSFSGNYTGVPAGTYYLEVSDVNQCVSQMPLEVIIETVPNVAPVISCPASLSVTNNVGVCGAVVNYTAPVGTDACPGASTVQIAGLASGSVFPTGTTTNTFQVTDEMGLSTSCSFTITVIDNLPPAFSPVASNMTVQCDGAGNTAALNAWIATHGGAIATDECGAVSWGNNFAVLSDLCGSTGSATVTFTATDVHGNASSTSATFTIIDNSAPSITAASAQSVECDGSGNTATLNAWLANHAGATASDICSGVTWSDNFTGLSDLCGATGSATVTFTATDACGNASSSTATFTIVDTTVPSITSAASQTVECDGAGNTAALNAWLANHGGATASDACSGITWTNNFTSLSDLCGSTGSASVTFTATDACGNAASSTATFTIVDTTVPSITAAANQTVECDGAGNSTALTAWLASHGGATASDVCSGVTWTNNYTSLSDLCGSTGSASVTFTATDACGNASSSTATFTIVDTTVPSITAASNQTVECDGAGNSATLTAWLASHGGATASDVCSGVTWGNNFTSLSDLCGSTGSASVTFTATDACGNASSSTATFTIVDTTVPSITSASSQTVECDGAGNSAALTAWLASHGGATASDACSGITWSNNFTSLSDLCGSTGSAFVAFTATDACGNASSSTATFTIVDTTVPSVTAAVSQTAECDGSGNSGALNAWLASHGGATASDICSGVNWSNNFTALSDLCGATGSATVTFTATDACGNASSSTATFTIVDTTAPVVTCPSNITVNNTLNQCGANVSYTATASDVCSGTASIIYDIAPGSFFNKGTTTVNVTATDVCGNTSTCSFTVTVVDNQIPAITCSPNIVTSIDPGVCGAMETYAVTFTDNCTGSTLVQANGLPSGATFPVGTTVNTFVVTDAAGNTNTCSFSVIVTDNQAPVIVNCPANFSSCNPVTWTPPTITDNCAGVVISSTAVPGSNFGPGTTTVTYTATDAYNNVSTCSFQVTRYEESVAATSITSDRDFNNICLGETVNLTINGGTLGQGGVWKWYTGSCAGTPLPAFTGMTTINVSPTVTTTYFARAEGTCNNTACVSITVVVSTTVPPNGPLAILTMPPYGAPGVTGTITCTSVPGATFYRWTSINGHINAIWFPSTPGPVETAVPSVNVLFNQSLSNYQIRLVAGNACGRTNNVSAHIRGTVPASTCLSGPVLACPNTTAIYSVASCPIPGTNSYQWVVTGNASITAGQGTPTITVSFGAGFTSGTVCVNGITNFGLAGPTTCLNVSNNTLPPGAISGNAQPCQASAQTYSITPVVGATSYLWSTNIVGATASGTTTTGSVQFPAGPFSGNVCVVAVSGCGSSTASCFAVTSGAAGVPGPILGPLSGICGAVGNYALSTNNANSYNWTYPAGITNVSLNGSNSIQLQFPSAPGSFVITVTAFYNCGSATSSITVNGEPGTPTVTPATICAGGTDETYIASAAGADSYNWTTSGAVYEQCTNPNCSNNYIIWDTPGGSFSVSAVNLCGVSAVPFSLSTNCRISEGGVMEAKVYPNPTTGKLTIEFTSYTGGNYNMTLTDMSGRTILTEDVKASSGKNQHQLYAEHANPGMYMLYIKDSNGQISVTKITKE